MKKVLFSLLLAGSLGLVSCQKEEIPAPAGNNGSTQAQNITVEYKIYAASGNVVIQYMAPGTNGELQLTSETSNRLETNITFEYQRGNTFSIKANNTSNSSDEVIVEIYSNGVLQKTATANAPGATAYAEVKIN
ncbi:MAG: hypothetical protein FD123_2444 [Bacteroidetes bacterium]|nr:MAG: hypothetical protein FD123_2444 [Bacteroidota bacterium]